MRSSRRVRRAPRCVRRIDSTYRTVNLASAPCSSRWRSAFRTLPPVSHSIRRTRAACWQLLSQTTPTSIGLGDMPSRVDTFVMPRAEERGTMRYILVDRITSLAPGQQVTAIKNVSASDDLVSHYGHGLSAMPSTMVLEAMAQAAGLLIAATIDCAAQPMLAKVNPFSSYGLARPGDRIVLCAELDELRDQGCVCRVTASIDGRLLASATIYLALVPFSVCGDAVSAEPMRLALADAFPGWFAASALQEAP